MQEWRDCDGLFFRLSAVNVGKWPCCGKIKLSSISLRSNKTLLNHCLPPLDALSPFEFVFNFAAEDHGLWCWNVGADIGIVVKSMLESFALMTCRSSGIHQCECYNLSFGLALNARFTTNGMCAKNNTIYSICGANKQ